MRTPAQTEASRLNAAHSTGPRTEEGKAASSLNALKAGATSRQTVLPWEDLDQYEAVLAGTIEHYRPQGETERFLTELVATTMWRYRRLLRVETHFMSAVDEDGTNPHAALATFFFDPEGAAKLGLMLRYLSNAAREYRNAVSELLRVQAARQASTPPPEPPAVVMQSPEPAEAASVPETAIGRAERRALDRAQRKAEKRARQAAWTTRQQQPGFVSYLSEMAA